MSELTTQLPERLNNTEETGLDAVLSIPLLRLIVEGGPVTVEQFAAAAGRPVDDVRTGLAVVPDTEYDDQGRIIGQGLTLRPTPHRFTVAGEELYTWCALDTLIFPTLLERAASVESVSPTSGEPIGVTIDPVAGVTSVAFNPKSPELLATADAQGFVKIWRLSNFLSEPGAHELEALEAMASAGQAKDISDPDAE